MRFVWIVLRSAPVSVTSHKKAPLYLLIRTLSMSQSLYLLSHGSSVARSLLPRLALETLLTANCTTCPLGKCGHAVSHSPCSTSVCGTVLPLPPSLLVPRAPSEPHSVGAGVVAGVSCVIAATLP